MNSNSPSAPVEILSGLRNALLRLHKVLLDSERAVYERDVEKINSPGQFLDLVMGDPWFAYLRDLSRMVVKIDERIDDVKTPVSREEAQRFLDEARALLLPSEFGKGFEKRYFEALQRDPEVVMTHSSVTRLISSMRG